MLKLLLSGTFGRRVLNIIGSFFSLVNKIVPKRKNQYLFFNSKEVYLNNYSYAKYLVESNQFDDKKIYYSMPEINDITVSKSDIIHVKSMVKTLFIFLTSEYVFYDTGNIRIKPSKRQLVINFWHGSPLKRIGHSAKKIPKDLKANSINQYSKIMVASPFFEDIYKKSFNINDTQILVGGQPRLDRLIKPKNIDFFIKNAGNINVMWMTTYRISYDGRLLHTNNSNWSETELPIVCRFEDLFELNKLFEKIKINLIIKIHHGSVFSEDNRINKLSNILLILDKDIIQNNVELYDVLGNCDALITDYSSVYFDFLLLNKKIGFIVDDIDIYEESNGFNFNEPLKLMAGEKITDLEELFSFFKKIADETTDEYAKNREEINNLTNEYKEFGNCYRVDKILERFN